MSDETKSQDVREFERLMDYGKPFLVQWLIDARNKVEKLEQELTEMEERHAEQLSECEFLSKEAGFEAGKRGSWL